MAKTVAPQSQQISMEEINTKFSELTAEKAAIMDGYSLAKAQLKQLQMAFQQLQAQNQDLLEYRESNEDYKEMLEKKTTPAPKKRARKKV
jgi:predicted nuclease with TOPRIM domain